jgi:hypothetical protein
MQLSDPVTVLLDTVKRDHAMTASMVSYRFGINQHALKTLEQSGQIFLVKRSLTITHETRKPRDLTFVCRDQRTANRPGTTLRHLAGVGEMRRRLGSPNWTFGMPNRQWWTLAFMGGTCL